MKFLTSKEKYTGLSTRLNDVLTEVHAKRPLLEFEVTHTTYDKDENKVARSVDVWQHGQKLGSIDAHYRKHSPTKGETETIFAVESPLIEKQRGRRNTKFCKSAPIAAKTVIEIFAKQPLSTLGSNLAGMVASRVSYLQSNAAAYFIENMRKGSGIAAATYLVEMYLGNNPEMPKSISSCMTEDTLKKYDNHKIALNVCNHLEKKNGYGVVYMKDGTLLVVDLSNYEYTRKLTTTYEMPQFMQEKFAMLKLLEKNQFAQDIGIKFDDIEDNECYFIVGGETVVH